MAPVITWALVIASGIFGLGMVSAIGSRMLRKEESTHHRGVAITRETQSSGQKRANQKNTVPTSAMSMAAGSEGAREDESTSKFGDVLAGAGRGSGR